MLVALFSLMMGVQSPDSIAVAAVRFYSPASATTTVEGTAEFRVPAAGPGQTVSRLSVQVTVLDSAGLELQRNTWQREVPAAAAASGARLVESFSFRAAAGRYRVVVQVTPEGGASSQRAIDVRAYAGSPGMSDLLLASQVRAASDSAVLGPGELQRAGMILRTGPVPRISPLEPSLSYYAELYPRASAVRGELRVEVMSAAGRLIVATPARQMEIGPQGGLSRGSIDLTGLPGGDYRLRLRLNAGDSVLSAEAPFAMGSLEAAMAQAAPAAAEARAEDLMFDTADSARLDTLLGPLVVVLESDEERIYRSLTPGGARRFLKTFWQRRDPTPQTPDNPVMTEFYAGVVRANELFREQGAGRVEGWRTDRGRIYLRHGRPDDVLRRPVASPRPYEVWRYTRGRSRFYVFWDQSGLGNYRLIGTNDNRESSVADWEQYLGPEGSQDVRQFIR
jgi:GWxTD domain-containing protein